MGLFKKIIFETASFYFKRSMDKFTFLTMRLWRAVLI